MRARAAASCAWLLLAVAACGGTSAVARTDRPARAPVAHAAATVWFEPPLPGPAALTVAHESGYLWQGEATATGATFPAPDGPCTLTLRAGGRTWERAFKLSPGERELTWRR